MDEFRYVSYAQEVIFGPGSLMQLGDAVDRLPGWKRVLLCTNRSMQVGGYVESVRAILGERLVDVFDQTQPHVHDVQVNQVLARVIEKKPDGILGMGGGSSLGMAKAVGYQAHLPVSAIPGTYAGSEMTAVYGLTHTDVNPPRKVTIQSPTIVPKLVLYDPELTLGLPPEMTASTGINALAHCIEALYSKTRNPLSTAAAASGAQHISNALLRCFQDGQDLEARTEMLLGAHLAGLALASVSMGLHHGLCHVLGGSAGIPHGIANSIILPYVIRFNADVTAPQLLPAAEAMGVPVNRIKPMVALEALVQKIFHLISQMNLPQHLAETGVHLQESDIPNLAELAYQNSTVQNNPKPITDVSQIEQLLMDAW